MRKLFLIPALSYLVFISACKAQLTVQTTYENTVLPGRPQSPSSTTYKIKLLPSQSGIKLTGFAFKGEEFLLNCPFTSIKDSAFDFSISKSTMPHKNPSPSSKKNTTPNSFEHYVANVYFNKHTYPCKLTRTQTQKNLSGMIVILYEKGAKKGIEAINKIDHSHTIAAP